MIENPHATVYAMAKIGYKCSHKEPSLCISNLEKLAMHLKIVLPKEYLGDENIYWF